MKLDLAENPLGPSGAALIASGLDGNIHIEALCLRKCGIKDHGMSSLSQVLKTRLNVFSLSLSSQITCPRNSRLFR